MSLMDVHTKPKMMFEDIISGEYGPVFPQVSSIPTSPVLPELVEPKATKPKYGIDTVAINKVISEFNQNMASINAQIEASAKSMHEAYTAVVEMQAAADKANRNNDIVRPEWTEAGFRVVTKAAALDLLDVVAGAHPDAANNYAGSSYFAEDNPKEGVCILGVMFSLLGYEMGDLRRHEAGGHVADDHFDRVSNRGGISSDASGVYPGQMRMTRAAATVLTNAQVRSDSGHLFANIARDVRALHS